jgi:hypothetical protein
MLTDYLTSSLELNNNGQLEERHRIFPKEILDNCIVDSTVFCILAKRYGG